MMMFAVVFEDNEEKTGLRALHMNEHLAFLDKNADVVRMAGPIKDAITGAEAGGMWLVKMANVDAVQQLIEADPFWPTGLRKTVRILEWNHVFSEGRRRI